MNLLQSVAILLCNDLTSGRDSNPVEVLAKYFQLAEPLAPVAKKVFTTVVDTNINYYDVRGLCIC